MAIVRGGGDREGSLGRAEGGEAGLSARSYLTMLVAPSSAVLI